MEKKQKLLLPEVPTGYRSKNRKPSCIPDETDIGPTITTECGYTLSGGWQEQEGRVKKVGSEVIEPRSHLAPAYPIRGGKKSPVIWLVPWSPPLGR